VLLDQLYTSDGLSANGSCYDDLFSNLLQRWRTKGVDFLKDLNGSFALLLHDPEKNEILVSTDRFSTYPLWCCDLEDSGIAISSDFTALAGLIHGTIDYASLWSFLTRGRPVGQHSFFNEIKAIRPATALLFRKGKLIEEVEWYKPRFEPEYDRSVSYWGDELIECVRAAIKDKMADSKAPGLLLSGGLDSRLIASIAPAETRCFTLADFNNIEMKTAAKAAKICGLEHFPIVRDENWYPDIIEQAATHSIGLWHWHNVHFMPLANWSGEWQVIDRVMLGMGFDTLLKGNQIKANILWGKTPDPEHVDEAVSFLTDFGAGPVFPEAHIEEILHPGAATRCRKAYREAVREELLHVIPIVQCVPDAWELFQCRSIMRVPYWTNITCLREFISARNIIFDNRFYDLYFRLPVTIRRTGSALRAALGRRNKRLVTLIDTNSRLPSFLPASVHSRARKTLLCAAALRNWCFRMVNHQDFKGSGAWTRAGRLWVHNSRMRILMDDLVKDTRALPEDLFDIQAVQRCWGDHKNDRRDCSETINAIAGLGIFYKELKSNNVVKNRKKQVTA